jgi:hypothetical protein
MPENIHPNKKQIKALENFKKRTKAGEKQKNN